jgi:hypothetical protein
VSFVSSRKEERKGMEFEIDFLVRWMNQLLLFLLSLERTEYYSSLRVHYEKLKTNKGKHSWL